MKEKLLNMLKEEGFAGFVVNSFEEAQFNHRKKNIVLLDDGIYLTFKAFENNTFGELVCWVEDEFLEDENVYKSAINAVIDLYTYSDEELDEHIKNDDLIEIFTPYEFSHKEDIEFLEGR